jgi:hypothetical protein
LDFAAIPWSYFVGSVWCRDWRCEHFWSNLNAQADQFYCINPVPPFRASELDKVSPPDALTVA